METEQKTIKQSEKVGLLKLCDREKKQELINQYKLNKKELKERIGNLEEMQEENFNPYRQKNIEKFKQELKRK